MLLLLLLLLFVLLLAVILLRARFVYSMYPMGKSYNSNTKTSTTVYRWGTIEMTHTAVKPVSGDATADAIDLAITVTNTFNQTISGLRMGPFNDVFQQSNWWNGGWAFGGCGLNASTGGCTGVKEASSVAPCAGNWNAPSDWGSPQCRNADPPDPQILVADFATGALVATIPQPTDGSTLGFPWVSGAFRLIVSFDPIAVGASASATVSLRFTIPVSAPPTASRSKALLGLANDTFAAYRAKYPNTVKWADRRPIGGLFPSDCGASCHCRSLSPEDCPNPRGYNFVSSDGSGINVTNATGMAKFKDDLLAYVNRSVSYCVDCMGNGDKNGPAACQGILVWSLEGQQYPQDISYVGNPQLLATLSPEMDNAADDMFKLITDAGLKCGMTLRPQQWTQNPKWSPTQSPMQTPFRYFQHNLLTADNYSDVQAVANLLIQKASYANKRWGCTMFYTDTTVCDPCKDGTIPTEVWVKVHEALPDCVFFPEESLFTDFAVAAPLQNNWGGYAFPTSSAVDMLYVVLLPCVNNFIILLFACARPLPSLVRIQHMLPIRATRARRLVCRARPSFTSRSHVHAMFTPTFAFTNTHDPRYGRDAFSFQLMQFPPGMDNNKAYTNQTVLDWYTPVVKRGDALLMYPWYNASENVFVKRLYEMAHAAQ